jgi:hypothetical protein
VSNLTIACHECNDAKGNRTTAKGGRPKAQAKAPLKDAAAVNATRWALYQRLVQTGLPKTHWRDAACVGASARLRLQAQGLVPLAITALGRRYRQTCRTNAFGVPDKAPKAPSVVVGFRTGDTVRAIVPATCVKAGVYVGRIAIRATGSCDIKTATDTVQGIHHRYCQPLQSGDGYAYRKGTALPPPSGR